MSKLPLAPIFASSTSTNTHIQIPENAPEFTPVQMMGGKVHLFPADFIAGNDIDGYPIAGEKALCGFTSHGFNPSHNFSHSSAIYRNSSTARFVNEWIERENIIRVDVCNNCAMNHVENFGKPILTN